MKTKPLLLSLVAFWALSSSPISANDDPIAKIGWKKIRDLELPGHLKEATGSHQTVELLELKYPGITERNHAIGGELRHTEVNGNGFVEMWTHYEDGSHYFSRTLGEFGPMTKLSGNSEWRPFLLPFFSDGKKLPSKLEVNLILPEGGKVEFRQVGLYQLPGDRTGAAFPSAGEWWSPSFGGIFGGFGGAAFGIWGAVCGTLASSGKGRRFVTASIMTAIGLGSIAIVTFVVAAISKQPHYVYYPLLLLGGFLLIGGVIGLFRTRRLYLYHELRAISAAD